MFIDIAGLLTRNGDGFLFTKSQRPRFFQYKTSQQPIALLELKKHLMEFA